MGAERERDQDEAASVAVLLSENPRDLMPHGEGEKFTGWSGTEEPLTRPSIHHTSSSLDSTSRP
jgi:hypothetical protein